ncbi:MAG: twin-arginine translocase TatA/TatE family subunit [Flavobacteriales bacterium]|nr:twin-arginine translocase TatA/TatE family subunit [Flavobacteriales bacterium]
MGATEIVFIFLIYLLLFGAKGIPSMARTMGSAVREFRSATDEIQREILGTTDGIRDEVNKVRDAADPTTSRTKAKDEDSKSSESPAS